MDFNAVYKILKDRMYEEFIDQNKSTDKTLHDNNDNKIKKEYYTRKEAERIKYERDKKEKKDKEERIKQQKNI